MSGTTEQITMSVMFSGSTPFSLRALRRNTPSSSEEERMVDVRRNCTHNSSSRYTPQKI